LRKKTITIGLNVWPWLTLYDPRFMDSKSNTWLPSFTCSLLHNNMLHLKNSIKLM